MKISHYCCFAFFNFAFIRGKATGDHIKQGGFATAVFTCKANTVAFFKYIVEIFHQLLVIKTFV